MAKMSIHLFYMLIADWVESSGAYILESVEL